MGIKWVEIANKENSYVCPECHGKVSYENHEYQFVCHSCTIFWDEEQLHLEIEEKD